MEPDRSAANHTPDVVWRSTATFPCAACGNHGVWNAARQDVVCISCGTVIVLPPAQSGSVERFDFVPLLRDRVGSGRTWQAVAASVRCTACHAVNRLEAGMAADRCKSCGAGSLVVLDQAGAPISPTGVVPFRLSAADADGAVRKWMAGRARMDFARSTSTRVDLRPVYLPWWNFFAHVNCPWRTMGTRTTSDGTREQVVKEGTVDLDLEESVPAVSSVPADLLTTAEPLDFNSARPFDARYLAGMAVEHYDVNLWDGWDAAHARMQTRLDRALRRDARTLLSPPEETWPSWSRESTRLILVPMFVGTHRGRTGDLPVIVNGSTGTVNGTWEWSLAARLVGVAILIGLAAAAVGAVWGLWLLLRAAGFRPLW